MRILASCSPQVSAKETRFCLLGRLLARLYLSFLEVEFVVEVLEIEMEIGESG